MTQQQTALEHLQVIRSLMEKAHIYRAISAPAALVGGVLATALSGWTIWGTAVSESTRLSPELFLGLWTALLVLCSVINVILLSREASRRDQPLVSNDMKLALRTLSPALGAGGIMGICFAFYWGNQTLAALSWIICYALALLSTHSFSPRSIKRLGRAFLLLGLTLFVVWSANPSAQVYPYEEAIAAVCMGLTFGLLHILYAVAVMIRKPQPPTSFE